MTRLLFDTAPAWLVGGLLLGWAACAVPVAPPGGPPDETPPALLEATPAADAVDVDAEALTLRFSEYVDEASFARAFSITPAFDEPPAFDWGRRSVTVRFPEPLRDSTTYLVTLDTELRDLRGVALRRPVTLAFSTGPTLDRGRLAGRVVDAVRGAPVAGIDVLAYTADAPVAEALPERPAYRTQTGPDGRFTFEYLSRRPYYVVALADRDRDRRPGPLEAFGVPPEPRLRADTTLPATLPVWVAAARDTVAPELQRVRPRSASRLELRFSEPVRLLDRDAAAWTLRDTTTQAAVAVEAVYTRPEEPALVYLSTGPLALRPHRVAPPPTVVDSTGTPAAGTPAVFTSIADTDTLALRFTGFLPDTLAPVDGRIVLPPRVRPGVRFNQPPADSVLRRVVAVRDTAGTPRAFLAITDDGTGYRLEPERGWAPGDVVDVEVTPPGRDTILVRRFEAVSERALGELSGAVRPDTSAVVVVELYAAEAPGRTPVRVARADATGTFRFAELPARTYRLRAFLDRDADGTWDAGRLAPYRPAEPVVWSADTLRVRPRWETVLPDTLRLEE